jgi:hypothetical protein
MEDVSGITNVIQGKGEHGVRSQGHAANLARLGSTRAKKRALIIEDQLEKVADLFSCALQAYSKEELQDEKGVNFVPDQFTDKFYTKVDAHSNSPIFIEDQRQLAFDLLKVNAIGRDSLLDLLDVPMKELLKERLKGILESEKQAQQQQRQDELAEQRQKQARGGK